MVLNKDQIEKEAVVEILDREQLRHASYDLTAAKIIDMDGEEHSFYKLPPQGMVYVVFAEKLNLKFDRIGFAHVKTSLTQKGIMATNIGIVDPGYEGYISTLLINFGSSNETINIGDPCLRLTFCKIEDYGETQSKAKKIDFTKYVSDRRKDTDNLGAKFLNISAVHEDVFKRVIKTLIGLGIIFSAASFAVAMYFQNKVSEEKELEKAISRYERRTYDLVEDNRRFQKQITVLIDSLKKAKTSEKKGLPK